MYQHCKLKSLRPNSNPGYCIIAANFGLICKIYFKVGKFTIKIELRLQFESECSYIARLVVIKLFDNFDEF